MLLFFDCFVFFQVFAHDQQNFKPCVNGISFWVETPPATEARQVARNIAEGKVTF